MMNRLSLKTKLRIKWHIISYIVMYAMKTFVIWEFTNPFWYITNLPRYTEDDRLFVLFWLLVYYGAIWVGVSMYIDDKTKS